VLNLPLSVNNSVILSNIMIRPIKHFCYIYIIRPYTYAVEENRISLNLINCSSRTPKLLKPL